MDKKANEITLKEHVEAITKAVPQAQVMNFEVRVSWNKKLQDYIITDGYNAHSTLIRFTVRRPKA